MGIPVPDDPEHTIHVWINALMNYITALGHPWSGDGTKQAAWPADVQVIGMDIVRFYAIYWPTMFFALGLAPPKTLLTHEHWTMVNFKMSKSRGNVADPFKAIETYGVDVVRYYLMRNGPLVTKSDLTLTIENRGEVQLNEANAPAREILFATLDQFESKMDTLEVNKAVALVPELVERANTFFALASLWSEMDPVRVAKAHLYAHQALHLAGILLHPVMPTKAAELPGRLGVQPDQRT